MSTNDANNANKMSPEKVKRLSIYIGAGCVVVIVLFYIAHFWNLYRERQELEAEAKAGPRVQIVQAKRSPPERTLHLVGEARPYASVTLFAKVSGYLKSISVDKGDVVKKNQLLAVIESPEIDKEYAGALAEARNKKSIAERMNQLLERQLVSPQEADQANSDSEVSSARLGSLEVQKGYETLRAPFPGTVTARYADAGALVQNAANSQTSALPVVTISQVDRLRVYAYVDQRDAAYIRTGAKADVRLDEQPNLHLEATVSRVSGELDPKTKMLLTEIDVDNKNSQMVPGSFVQVTLVVQIPPGLQIPAQALAMIQGKTTVPVVDADNTLHYREVRVAENDGIAVSILSGITEADNVALNVGNNLPDGSRVRPVVPDAPPGQPQQQQQPRTPGGTPAAGTAAAAAPTPAPTTESAK